MNYLKIYLKLVRNAEKRTKPAIYEKHHIFPKSIYGKNNRIVKLSPREHYMAHALLYKAFVKRYGVTDQKTIKMMHAFRCMHITKSKVINYQSRLYEILRKDFMKSQRGKAHPLFGVPCSEQRKLKIGKANKGRLAGDKNPMYGKFGQEHPRFGQHHTEQTKEKIGMSRRGEKHPMFGKTGEENPFFGRKHTEESLRIMSEKASKNNRGKKWWTNGEKDSFSKECPDGFYRGRSANKKNK